MDSIGFEPHDHASCIAGTLRAVETLCHQRKLHLTPVRRRVLEILLQKHRALGAYDILDQLRQEGMGSQPPVAYRALDFLVSHGFAHKIERLNAFTACAHPGDTHSAAFLICRVCDRVAETLTEPDTSLLADAARDTGFTVERAVIEALGLCPDCAAEARP